MRGERRLTGEVPPGRPVPEPTPGGGQPARPGREPRPAIAVGAQPGDPAQLVRAERVGLRSHLAQTGGSRDAGSEPLESEASAPSRIDSWPEQWLG